MSEIKCPNCESANTEEHDLEYEYDEKLGKNVLYRSMTCGECKQEFTIKYVQDESETVKLDKAEPFWQERTH